MEEKVDQLLREIRIAPERKEQDRDQYEPEWQRVLTECRLESIEQYNRRDCLFFGPEERDNEDCTDVIVNTSRSNGCTD